VKLAHAIGRVLKSVKSRAGRGATFGTGVAVPFVARLPPSGSRAPASVSCGGHDHRVVAASSVRGCLVVSGAYCFSPRGRQVNEKHGHEKTCVWRNYRRQVLFEFPHENAGLEDLHVHGEFEVRLPLALSKLPEQNSFQKIERMIRIVADIQGV
jgi:hypothetical protein